MGSRRGRYAALIVAAAGACTRGAPPAALHGRVVDGAGRVVTLTWVVGQPNIPDLKWEGIMRQAVTLEVASGGVVRALELEPQQGSLFPHNQVVCNTSAFPLAIGEVAKITFDEGAAVGYAVQRRHDGTLELVQWSQTEGPPIRRTVQAIDAPPNADIEEAIIELDTSGARVPLRCEA